jgi:hypothetical protein
LLPRNCAEPFASRWTVLSSPDDVLVGVLDRVVEQDRPLAHLVPLGGLKGADAHVLQLGQHAGAVVGLVGLVVLQPELAQALQVVPDRDLVDVELGDGDVGAAGQVQPLDLGRRARMTGSRRHDTDLRPRGFGIPCS